MNTKTLLFFLSLTFSCGLFAQEPLPYSTNFSTSAERNAWEEFRMGADAFYNWGFHTGTNPVAYHDYPVGATENDTTTDWLVSPEIYFHSSSKLGFSLNIFTMMGTWDVDRFEVWYSTGAKDPAAGDYEMIGDFTDFGGDGTWRDTSGIVLSDTGMGYIAFVYQTTNNWFTISLDSIEITPDVPLAVPNPVVEEIDWRFRPDNRSLQVSKAQTGDVVLLYDLTGATIKQERVNGPVSSIDLSDVNTSLVIARCLRNGEPIKSGKLFLNP